MGSLNFMKEWNIQYITIILVYKYLINVSNFKN